MRRREGSALGDDVDSAWLPASLSISSSLAHGGAPRTSFIADIAVFIELHAAANRLDVRRIGPRHVDRRPPQRAFEIWRRQIARVLTGRVGVGDVFGKHPLV